MMIKTEIIMMIIMITNIYVYINIYIYIYTSIYMYVYMCMYIDLTRVGGGGSGKTRRVMVLSGS